MGTGGGGGACRRSNFDSEVKKHGEVLVEFVQPGCQPCDQYKKNASKLAPVVKGTKKIRVTLGPTECENLADRFGVRETPSLVYFKNGKKVGRPIVVKDTSVGFSKTKKTLASRRGSR